MKNKIFFYTNQAESSLATEKVFKEKVKEIGYEVADTLDEEVTLLVVIGGDGTFLDAIHAFDFPSIPIVGVNTGHLGFFQEFTPDDLDPFLHLYAKKKYTLQSMQIVYAAIRSQGRTFVRKGLNEIIVASASDYAYSAHFNIYIGGSFIERFSGDGLLISTPAGSTAYNYSLGGSIVDPRLRLLQATPIAPMNTTAYRSFTSSILLPPDKGLGIKPDEDFPDAAIVVAYDGFSERYESFDSIDIKLSGRHIDLIRLESYDFWAKVKSKFL